MAEISSKVKVCLNYSESDFEKVRIVVGDARIRIIGNYFHCSFITKRKGYFKPNSKANSHIGEVNKLEEIDEVSTEFILY